MHKKERTQTLKENIKYLLKSRGETQQSLSDSSGLTRSTIYKILDGRVINVQHSTIQKISSFFGVSYKEIETLDIEEKEIIERSISLGGNMNPSAVPIIRERRLMQSLDDTIGQLAVSHKLTYYFGVDCNLIGVCLDNDIAGAYEAGDVLIVKKGLVTSGVDNLAYKKDTKQLFIAREICADVESVCMIGVIIEERLSHDLP